MKLPTSCSARFARASASWFRVGLGYLTLDRQSRTLSGGEVQRISLTTALGTSLVNTLFRARRASIGLHPRDMRRVIEVMHRLRDNGNSLLVVEHDPQIMLTADRVIDMGPGPASTAARSCSRARPQNSRRRSDTLTAKYLSGRLDAVTAAGKRGAPGPGAPAIKVRGATEHNLKNLDVEISTATTGLRDGRVRFWQVHAGAGRALCGPAPRARQADRNFRARTSRSKARTSSAKS